RMVADKARQIAADHLEADPADLELAGGRVRVKGSPDRGMPLGAVAVLSNPVRYAFGGGTEAATQFAARPRPGPPLQDGEQPGLEATGYYSPPGSTWASGCHAAYVRVDPKTFRLEILKYVVVHDPGSLDVDRQAHPDVVARRLRPEHLQRPVEKLGIVAAVVDDRVAVLPRDADDVGKLVRLDQVAAPHLDAVGA